MADNDRPVGEDVQSGEGAPEAPVLNSPTEEALVDGENVTLRWETMEGVDAYLVEVAADAAFHEVLVQEETQDTTLALEGLPTDGDRYYWRVLARRGGQWSHGDRIESFASVSAEQARAGAAETPDRGEGYGPAAELFSAAGTEAAAEATGEESRFAREREMGVAHEGVESGQIIGFAGAVVVAIIIIVCVLFFWITSVAQSTRSTVTEGSQYPELQAIETQAAEQLRQYELVSERDSAYRIPIGEAMRIVADESYETGPNRRYSNELPLGPRAPLADSLARGASVPESAAPEGPAGTQGGAAGGGD